MADILPQVVPEASGTAVLATLRPASLVIAVTALVIGAIGPAVDTRLRPMRLLLGLGVAIAALAVALLRVPSFSDMANEPIGQSVFAGLWLVVAGAHLVSGARRRRRHHFAAAVMGLGFALAGLAGALTLAGGSANDPGAAILRVLALALVLAGTTRDLEGVFGAQRAQLLDSTLTVETVNARRRAEHAAREERVHDARNAILAIDGAAQTLERFRDRLEVHQREALSHAVSEEIRRLQHLIESDGVSEDIVPFEVAELLETLTTTERARGSRIDVEVENRLGALGRPTDTAEVLRNLLDNARRYAPGSQVTVRGQRDGEWTVIWVEDRGRGVTRNERDVIFERGHRGQAAAGTEGSGLGLFVSRRLMRDQGGDMWVEGRPGGGASFALCLPAAAVDETDQADEAADAGDAASAGPRVEMAKQTDHAADAGPGGAPADHEDDREAVR